MWRPLALLCILPCAALAQTPYDGRYAMPGLDAGPCVYNGSDNGVFEVRENAFWSVESMCRLTNPVDVRDMPATLYDAQCSGEGETWGYRMMLLETRDGIAVIRRGRVLELNRCG